MSAARPALDQRVRDGVSRVRGAVAARWQRIPLRARLTAEAVEAGADVVERVAARGDTRTERLVSLVLLGDLVSLYLAVLRGKDPASIDPIVTLKAALAER